MIRIKSIAVENLRSYQQTSLTFGKLTVLVGENNEGKSSILKMLERLMNTKPTFWSGDRALSEQEFLFWYPANNARHRARRFTLTAEFVDGRAARRFDLAKGDSVDLRFAVDSNGICRLNVGRAMRGEVHDEKAVELLTQIQEQVRLMFLPPVRDASSSLFTEKLTADVKSRLAVKLLHNKAAGAPKEYRLAKDAIEKIKEIIKLHGGELAHSAGSPLGSMLRSSEVRVEIFPADIMALIEKSMFVYLSTGDHDASKVLPKEVGNGLQSLIDINLSLEAVLQNDENKHIFVIIEEPEAFLHPSAQRQFMQFLRRALKEKIDSAVLTTHSPIVVDESKYEEIVLVRNQRHFLPGDLDRSSINTSLMTTGNSEVFFARTVVIVEGEGDKAFLNTLFRRIKEKAPVCVELAGIVFQEAGGCRSFAPWLKLVRSYRRGNEDPFDCVWLMDSDAAGGDDRPVLRVASDCKFNLSPAQRNEIVAFGDLQWGVDIRVTSASETANVILESFGGFLFSCDLEWAFFNGATAETVQCLREVMRKVDITAADGDPVTALARRLGSKIVEGSTAEGAKKQPYIRASIAEAIDLKALPPEIYSIVHRILSVSFKDAVRRDELIEACGLRAGVLPAH